MRSSRSIDSIIVASSFTSTMTIMDRYGTQNNTGIKLLNKMNRTNPKVFIHLYNNFLQIL